MSDYYVLGNWKSNGRRDDLNEFIKTYSDHISPLPDEVKTGIALPFPLLSHGSTLAGLDIGSQNVSAFGEGAYTGEVTAGMLNDATVDFCLVGHSERRQYFGESVDDTAKKLDNLLKENIFAVFCIGETLERRQSGALEAVLREQLAPIQNLANGKLAIAYEPVWAIGTGVAAKPSDVAQAHGMIRGMLHNTACSNAPILYGGSVKPGNAQELAGMNEVAGFLVGGASLKGDSFAGIVSGFLKGKHL